MQWLCRREREVSAQFAQANRKESLRSQSSEGQKDLVKPKALFSSEQGNLIRSSVFRNANPSNLRGSLLEGNKDHLLNQARSDLAKQELHVESLNKCIGELHRLHPEIILKEFNLTTCKKNEKQSLNQEGQRLVTQVKTDKIKAQFRCRHLRRHR